MKKVTECADARYNSGLKQGEVALAVGLSGPVFSLYENRKRNASQERTELFFHEVHHAIYRVLKTKKENSQDLELNTYVKNEERMLESLDDEIQDELDFELHYESITEDIYVEIIEQYINKGKTVVNAAAFTGVCEHELQRRLDKDNIGYDMGDNWENLVY